MISEAVVHAWRERTNPQISHERNSGQCLAAPDSTIYLLGAEQWSGLAAANKTAANRTTGQSGAEQWPRPDGSGQNQRSFISRAVAHAYRRRIEPEVSQERSSCPCLVAAHKTKGQSGAKQWPKPGGSEHNHRSVRSGAVAQAWRRRIEP
ncbi:hypothetical protein RRG08_027289 [Elysia crispata]|uniref:Uncharacterized protein n=1 Tax=Elysia crispata TaxID=231223 RepID=A0AAE1AYQ7_9GAST|nr:hypothetical protein RRG08_027289 [Elysia crispata]